MALLRLSSLEYSLHGIKILIWIIPHAPLKWRHLGFFFLHFFFFIERILLFFFFFFFIHMWGGITILLMKVGSSCNGQMAFMSSCFNWLLIYSCCAYRLTISSACFMWVPQLLNCWLPLGFSWVWWKPEGVA